MPLVEDSGLFHFYGIRLNIRRSEVVQKGTIMIIGHKGLPESWPSMTNTEKLEFAILHKLTIVINPLDSLKDLLGVS